MDTSLNIDEKLLAQVQRASGLKSPKEAVILALKEFIRTHKAKKELIEMFHSVDYDEDYDYKALRD